MAIADTLSEVTLSLEEKLVTAEMFRRLKHSLIEVRTVDHACRRYFHVAPLNELFDIPKLNALLMNINAHIVRLGSQGSISFMECGNRVILGRLTYRNFTVALYPAVWTAEQMSNGCRYPLEQLQLSKADFYG